MDKIVVITDGNTQIGLGHVYRCLTLARELRKRNCHVSFFTKSQEAISKIENENFSLTRIENIWDSEHIINAIRNKLIDLIIIDSYIVSFEYLQDIKNHTKKIMYIDDLVKFRYPVDIIVNGSALGDYADYYKYDTQQLVLSGVKYNLLREEFRDLPIRNINNQVRRLLLTNGGADPNFITKKFLEFICNEKRLMELVICVVVGNAFMRKEEIYDFAKKNGNIEVIDAPKRMSELMLKSDIAISAGGTTLYELCATGTPTIAYLTSETQRAIVDKMKETNCLECIGMYSQVDEHILNNSILKLSKGYEQREKLSKAGQSLVDGRGAIRVVNEILYTLNKD